jgi:ADP-ribosylglycohydrolase
LPAGFLAQTIAHIIEGKTLHEAVELGIRHLIKYDGHEETLKKIMLAIELSFSLESVENAILELGEGTGGEEALAIALYCSLKYFYDFRKGVQAAVNHSGVSDTTGTIAGAILGALLGGEDLPRTWTSNLENAQSVDQLAVDSLTIFKGHRSLPIKRYPLN